MTEVARIYSELVSLGDVVAASNSPSDISAFESMAAKTLLLSAASYFESRICEAIEACALKGGAPEVYIYFIRNTALGRKYNLMFNWEAGNANKFFSLFGPESKVKLAAAVASKDGMADSVRDFIFLSNERNQLVHNNYASFSLSYDVSEVWRKFESANRFADWLGQGLDSLVVPIGVDEGAVASKSE